MLLLLFLVARMHIGHSKHFLTVEKTQKQTDFSCVRELRARRFPPLLVSVAWKKIERQYTCIILLYTNIYIIIFYEDLFRFLFLLLYLHIPTLNVYRYITFLLLYQSLAIVLTAVGVIIIVL